MYSVNWATKVVTIPKSDTTLVTVSPDVRELDATVLWENLRSLQDDPDGMSYPDIVQNTAPKVLAGATYARIVEIINGYTLTFQDGLYAVNIVGGNTNVADVTNKNQVSVNTANSAGFVQVAGSGGGGATVDFNDLMDGQEIETGFTMRAAMRLMLSALAGKVSGGAGPVVEFRNVTDTKTRIASTADEHGNRNPVEYDVSD